MSLQAPLRDWKGRTRDEQFDPFASPFKTDAYDSVFSENDYSRGVPVRAQGVANVWAPGRRVRAVAPQTSTVAIPNTGRRHPFSAARITVPEAPASVMGPSSRDRAPGSSNKAVWASPEHVASGVVERAFRSSPAFRSSAAFWSSAAFRSSAVSPME